MRPCRQALVAVLLSSALFLHGAEPASPDASGVAQFLPAETAFFASFRELSRVADAIRGSRFAEQLSANPAFQAVRLALLSLPEYGEVRAKCRAPQGSASPGFFAGELTIAVTEPSAQRLAKLIDVSARLAAMGLRHEAAGRVPPAAEMLRSPEVVRLIQEGSVVALPSLLVAGKLGREDRANSAAAALLTAIDCFLGAHLTSESRIVRHAGLPIQTQVYRLSPATRAQALSYPIEGWPAAALRNLAVRWLDKGITVSYTLLDPYLVLCLGGPELDLRALVDLHQGAKKDSLAAQPAFRELMTRVTADAMLIGHADLRVLARAYDATLSGSLDAMLAAAAHQDADAADSASLARATICKAVGASLQALGPATSVTDLKKGLFTKSRLALGRPKLDECTKLLQDLTVFEEKPDYPPLAFTSQPGPAALTKYAPEGALAYRIDLGQDPSIILRRARRRVESILANQLTVVSAESRGRIVKTMLHLEKRAATCLGREAMLVVPGTAAATLGKAKLQHLPALALVMSVTDYDRLRLAVAELQTSAVLAGPTSHEGAMVYHWEVGLGPALTPGLAVSQQVLVLATGLDHARELLSLGGGERDVTGDVRHRAIETIYTDAAIRRSYVNLERLTTALGGMLDDAVAYIQSVQAAGKDNQPDPSKVELLVALNFAKQFGHQLLGSLGVLKSFASNWTYDGKTLTIASQLHLEDLPEPGEAPVEEP